MQQMVAMERRAPLLYGSPPKHLEQTQNLHLLPHHAIQVEVARQLAGLQQDLENQRRILENTAS